MKDRCAANGSIEAQIAVRASIFTVRRKHLGDSVYSRELEADSDRFGAELLSSQGYDPKAIGQALVKIGLFSRICGRVPARVGRRGYDTKRFESPCRIEIRTLFS